MLAEIPATQVNSVLDETAAALLKRAGWSSPLVDAVELAERLGLRVVVDDGQTTRARIARLALPGQQRSLTTIVVRSEDRNERTQWSVAHEIGEYASCDAFAGLGLDPAEAPAATRESVANALAARLLLHSPWFAAAGAACDWRLFELKSCFPTASHELIALRMLDFLPNSIMSVFDNDRLTWRRRAEGRPPAITSAERQCRRIAHTTGAPQSHVSEGVEIRAWPIHDAEWKREIVRAAWPDFE